MNKVKMKGMAFDIISLTNQRERLKEEEDRLRGELTQAMLDNDIKTLSLGNKEVAIKQYGSTDEEQLKEKYPEIYMSGATYKFSPKKAKDHHPANVVDRAVNDCEVNAHQKIQIRQKRKRRKTKQTR